MDVINRYKKCLIIFFYLEKAFGSIDQNLLFYQLDCMNIKFTALKWFKCYICERKQVVSISNQTSEERYVEYGIVRGSALGPLLVLIYINNLQN